MTDALSLPYTHIDANGRRRYRRGGHATDETTTARAPRPLLGADWGDPIEDGVRGRVRAFIGAILEEELEAALGRGRHERAGEGPRGWRHGHRDPEFAVVDGAPGLDAAPTALWPDAPVQRCTPHKHRNPGSRHHVKRQQVIPSTQW